MSVAINLNKQELNRQVTELNNNQPAVSTNITHFNPHLNAGFMQVNSIDSAKKCAAEIVASAFCPKDMKGKLSDIVVALQYGQELGLKPMQALQNIAVINGRPCIWGDAMIAICRQSPDFEYMKEEYLKDCNGYICRVKRKNEPEYTYTFTEEDARKANLWGKQGPWTQYPKRMLQMRARGFCLRDACADLLRGVISREEALDYPADRVNYSKVGNTYEAAPVVTVEVPAIDSEQLAMIKDLIKESETKEEDICKYLNILAIEEMPADKYSFVGEKLLKKIAIKHKELVNKSDKEVKNNEPTDKCAAATESDNTATAA